MSGMNIGQILMTSILSKHSPGLKTRTRHSAGNCIAFSTQRRGCLFQNDLTNLLILHRPWHVPAFLPTMLMPTSEGAGCQSYFHARARRIGKIWPESRVLPLGYPLPPECREDGLHALLRRFSLVLAETREGTVTTQTPPLALSAAVSALALLVPHAASAQGQYLGLPTEVFPGGGRRTVSRVYLSHLSLLGRAETAQ
jgi:hypothetical protein